MCKVAVIDSGDAEHADDVSTRAQPDRCPGYAEILQEQRGNADDVQTNEGQGLQPVAEGVGLWQLLWRLPKRSDAWHRRGRGCRANGEAP